MRTESKKLWQRLKMKLSRKGFLTPWAVGHVPWTAVNRFQTGTDGRSSWQRMNRKPYTGAIACPAEKVQYRDTEDHGKLEDRWPFGVWVGKTLLGDTHIVLTPDGVRTARTIARLSEEPRSDEAFVKSCKGSPWNPLGTAAREKITAGGEAMHKPASRRRLYITEAILERHGKTKGYEACRGG